MICIHVLYNEIAFQNNTKLAECLIWSLHISVKEAYKEIGN